jgi:hypothetical protein
VGTYEKLIQLEPIGTMENCPTERKPFAVSAATQSLAMRVWWSPELGVSRIDLRMDPTLDDFNTQIGVERPGDRSEVSEFG